MATVNKDFKIKSGLIVEGLQGTINGKRILTETAGDQYILDLIGGETLVKSVEATQLEVTTAGKLSVKDNVFDDHGSAAAAQTAAAADATTKANNAKSGAEATAASDATTKANAAQAAAISAASSDASTKADAAETAAKTYAEGLATDVASDLSDHEMLTYGVHGVEGLVVGTTDAQTLTNKTIGDTLNFTGAGAMTINSDSHIVLTPAAGSSVKWGADVLATRAYADQAEADAVSTASADATSKANAAEADANTYTDGKISTEVTDRNSAIASAIGTEVTDRNSAIATAKTQAIADAKSYTDAEVSALVDSAPELLDTLNELAAAIADNPNYATDAANAVAGRVAKSGDTMTGDLVLPGAPTLALHAATKGYVDSAADTAGIAAQGAADQALEDANDYTDSAISTEVTNRNSAIGTAKSEAGVIAQGYADTAETDAKAYTDVRETAIKLYADQAEADAVATAALDATSKANAAELAAKNYADALTSSDVAEGTNLYFTDARAIAAVGGTIVDQIDLLTTDDIEEGETNLYFEDGRAKASAAALLTGATKTNITITGTGAGLTITAENGVGDSTTDELAEGVENLYFTTDRAVNALQAVVPNFTEIDLNSVAKQFAAITEAPTAGIQAAYGFMHQPWRSAEFTVKVAYGTHTEISKVLLTLDSSNNIAITEYAIVGTNGSLASSVSANVYGLGVQIDVTTVSNDSTITVVGTLLK